MEDSLLGISLVLMEHLGLQKVVLGQGLGGEMERGGVPGRPGTFQEPDGFGVHWDNACGLLFNAVSGGEVSWGSGVGEVELQDISLSVF